jgi:SAM-dependent methyltransferase
MGRTQEEERTIEESVYYGENYFSRGQLSSFSTQIYNVAKVEPRSILEIGKGNGLVSDYFRKAGVAVTTVDINPALKPDICGDILHLSDLVEGRRFDAVICAEVLEHLPFSRFQSCIEQIAKVTCRKAIITLPSCRRSPIDMGLTFKFPYCERQYWRLFLPLYKRPIANEHHWEIGSDRHTERRSIKRILERQFFIESDVREFLKPYHVFFTLKQKSSE